MTLANSIAVSFFRNDSSFWWSTNLILSCFHWKILIGISPPGTVSISVQEEETVHNKVSQLFCCWGKTLPVERSKCSCWPHFGRWHQNLDGVKVKSILLWFSFSVPLTFRLNALNYFVFKSFNIIVFHFLAISLILQGGV